MPDERGPYPFPEPFPEDFEATATQEGPIIEYVITHEEMESRDLTLWPIGPFKYKKVNKGRIIEGLLPGTGYYAYQQSSSSDESTESCSISYSPVSSPEQILDPSWGDFCAAYQQDSSVPMTYQGMLEQEDFYGESSTAAYAEPGQWSSLAPSAMGENVEEEEELSDSPLTYTEL